VACSPAPAPTRSPFRLFLWLVPLALVAVTVAGWVAADSNLSTDDLVRRFGIVRVAARYVHDASKESTTTLVVVFLIALYALLLASRGAVRAIRVAHLLAWRMPIVRLHGSTVAALSFAGGATWLVIAAGVVNTVRARDTGPVLWLLLVVVYGVVAVVLLAWLYLLGRLTISSAIVNASLWRRAHPAADDAPGAGTSAVGFRRDG
jgi:uncharacterized BrkB/YihY/UPF0761 family membrane protein